MRLLTGLCLAVLAVVSLVPTASAQAAGPVQVRVDLHLISAGAYDPGKGTFTMDFYLHLRWNVHDAPANFTATAFEFTNGRAASKDLQSDDTAADGTRDVWYRIQANLQSDPDFRNYPFDEQTLPLVIEDTRNTNDALVYVAGLATMAKDAHLAGWTFQPLKATVAVNDYPFEQPESYSQLTFTLTLEREKVASGMRAFLPPLAFMLVASFSFFFDRSQAANRLSLGTGMLITAVGFHISQSVTLPSTGSLSLFDRVMISVYAFIAMTILVTAVMAFEGRFRVPDYAMKVVQKRGVWLSFAVPVVVFLLLMIR